METEFILYVQNQSRSRDFYQQLLGVLPILDVPGMTEFELAHGVKLGIMPENGIAKILNGRVPHPKIGSGIPRCELYLIVENAQTYMQRGVQIGGVEVSELKERNWGHKVGYISDPDGHIVAFAERSAD